MTNAPAGTSSNNDPSNSSRLNLYFLIFALSGGAGLIYESIWTHYLKLFLGHAAYAQTLVLAIFMGCMAIGSALAARFGQRLKNPLAAYAIVEGLVGIAAIVFDSIYNASVNQAYEHWFPNLETNTILLLKWSVATMLILPQSILLGATFPLMSSGILRRFSAPSGQSLAFLYFNNSLGAAIGILLSGYMLIPFFGLPNTIRIAGTVNLLIAASVWMLSRADGRSYKHFSHTKNSTEVQHQSKKLLLLMIGAAITGAASFMYEIAWIRMLSMVLGSSTHAFELMLSAFILGLAIGGFVIRHYIDHLRSPLRSLAYIQLSMGAFAAITIIIYGSSFDLMGYTVNNLDRTAANYWFFNLICHGIALLIMLPATICAGMTLPLITNQLLSTRHGESTIGYVYASNTLGAIVGIVLSIQLIMPSFGLKTLILFGSGLDILLGVGILLHLFLKSGLSYKFIVVSCIPALAIFLFVTLFVQLNPLAMASGIYTSGVIKNNREMIFSKDGKTASISFFRNDDYLAVATNGKTEAAISEKRLSKDEPTMILLGLLPLSIIADTESVAIIGIGSGLTSHSVLLSTQPTQVDTIEIEPAMVEAAQLFDKRVERVFNDPRSYIHIEDAKSYFSNHSSNYDVIISEPSNPWVSGVAGLFSQEFYQHIQRYLKTDGLFVQWVHLYHIDPLQIASVVKALSPQFSDYRIYTLNYSDIAIVATKAGEVPLMHDQLFNDNPTKEQLSRLGIESLDDLTIRELGSKQTLDSFFHSYSAPAHSDFSPYLDYSAARSRFLGASATSLLELSNIPKAIFNFMGQEGRQLPNKVLGNNYHLPTVKSVLYSQQLLDKGQPQFSSNCSSKAEALGWIKKVHVFADHTLPYFSEGEIDSSWEKIANSNCLSYLSEISLNWIELYRALATADAEHVITSAHALFPFPKVPDNVGEQFLASTLLAAYIQQNQYQEIEALLSFIDFNQSKSVILRYVSSGVHSVLLEE